MKAHPSPPSPPFSSPLPPPQYKKGYRERDFDGEDVEGKGVTGERKLGDFDQGSLEDFLV